MPRRPKRTRRPRPATLIAEIPHEERPRERLLHSGAEALTDSELVAVLLKNGRPGASVLELARELLAEVGGLAGLATACPETLRRDGVAEVKLATLLAAAEIGRRMAAANIPDRNPLKRPGAVATYLNLRYGRIGQEVVGAIYLDARYRLIAERELFRGVIDRALVEPRVVLREGLLRAAAGLILFHTHPSGDPAPSREDIRFTRRMVRAGEVVGIELIDHLVVGAGGRWVSLRERGGM